MTGKEKVPEQKTGTEGKGKRSTKEIYRGQHRERNGEIGRLTEKKRESKEREKMRERESKEPTKIKT